MNKKLLALAVAAAMVAPAAALAEATMYGKVRLAVEGHDHDYGADNVQINSHSSRIGVKGSEDLGSGLKAVYKLEFGVGISGPNWDKDNGMEFGKDDFMSDRNAFVGLAGDFGTLVIGRHDTPLKMSTGKLDYFGDTAADYNAPYLEAYKDRRANGTVAYITPNMGGLTIAAAAVPGENNEADGLADAYSIAAMYNNSGIIFSAAYEAGDTDINTLAGTDDAMITAVMGENTVTREAEVQVGDLAQTRVGLGYDAGTWRIGAVWENYDLEMEDYSMTVGGEAIPVTAADVDQDTYTVGAGFDFGNNTLKAKYFDVEDTRDGFAVGLDHNLSKRTQAYLLYADSSDEVVGSNDIDHSVWALGMNHKF